MHRVYPLTSVFLLQYCYTIIHFSPVADNEVSVSSDSRDVYKQRFSVTAHPSQPLILCSDGYLLTVMELPHNLTSLVMCLTEQCRVEHKSVSLVDLSRNRLSDISNVVHSAKRQFPFTAKSYDVTSDDHSKLCTAFCLLLISEQFTPHHGHYPSQEDCGDLITARDLVLDLIGMVSMSNLAPLVLRLLELMPLDIYHSHYNLYAELLSHYLHLCVTELGDVLHNNSSSSELLMDSYCTRVSTILRFIQYVIEIVNSEYSLSSYGAASSSCFSFLLPSLRCLVKHTYSFVGQLKRFSEKSNISEVKSSVHVCLQLLKFAKHWITLLTCTKASDCKPLKGKHIYSKYHTTSLTTPSTVHTNIIINSS